MKHSMRISKIIGLVKEWGGFLKRKCVAGFKNKWCGWLKHSIRISNIVGSVKEWGGLLKRKFIARFKNKWCGWLKHSMRISKIVRSVKEWGGLPKRRQSQMLSHLIKQQRKEFGHFPTGSLPLIKALWRLFLSDIYLLSPKKIIAVFFIAIFIIAILILLELGVTFLLSKIFPQILEDLIACSKTLFGEREHFQNLLMMALAGISGIIFSLVILIAGSLLNKEATDKGRVLLTVSYLLRLVVVTVFTFFLILFKIVVIVPSLLVFCIGLSVVWSLYRIIHVLLHRHLFAQERAKLLTDLLKESTDLAIDERIGNSILLLKFLDISKIKLIYSFVSSEDRSRCHFFDAPKLGTITDIDLSKLEKIANLIDEEAKEKGYSFTDEEAKEKGYSFTDEEAKEKGYSFTDEEPETSVGEEVKIKEAESKYLIKNDKRYLMKKFNDEITESHRTLLYIDKQTFRR